MTETYQTSKILAGNPQEVWEYLTVPEKLESWLGLGKLGEAGSTYEIVQTNKAPFPMPGRIYGTILEVDPPRLLRFTWQHIPEGGTYDPAADTTVTFELSPHPNGVKLTLTHTKISTTDLKLAHAGWQTHLDFLNDRLTGRTPEPFARRFESHFDGDNPWETVQARHPEWEN